MSLAGDKDSDCQKRKASEGGICAGSLDRRYIMGKLYFTIAGTNHYYGTEFMEPGMEVNLVKEPDNEFDKEAIKVEMEGLGHVGYVANSPYTVLGESMSAMTRLVMRQSVS